ncbi:MAG: c-type cytochrome [Pseudomonadota bacterium]
MWLPLIVLGMTCGVAQANDNDAGKNLYAQKCASCHGANGEGMGTFPALAGKPAALIGTMFKAYDGNATVGPMSSMMWAVTREVTPMDVEKIGKYMESLKKK